MKTYIGTKIINAKPMTRIDYNVFRGWSLPENENGGDEGYLVEYTDGGVANTEAYKGYISWSPKEVFEKSYKEFESNTAPWQIRLFEEREALDHKIYKLESFLGSSASEELLPDQIELLSTQLDVMQEYSFILSTRLKG